MRSRNPLPLGSQIDARDGSVTVCASTIRHARVILIDEADRSAAILRGSSVRGVEVVAASQLELLGRALVGAIENPAED